MNYCFLMAEVSHLDHSATVGMSVRGGRRHLTLELLESAGGASVGNYLILSVLQTFQNGIAVTDSHHLLTVRRRQTIMMIASGNTTGGTRRSYSLN